MKERMLKKGLKGRTVAKIEAYCNLRHTLFIKEIRKSCIAINQFHVRIYITQSYHCSFSRNKYIHLLYSAD